MMKRNTFTAALISLIFLLSWIIISSVKNPEIDVVEDAGITQENPYYIANPEIPERLIFAGEKVPLNLYYVREALDKELIVNMYWHSSTIQAIKRANRYFPMIEKILREENVPVDFKYLAVIESNLLDVVSPAGATGIWQFMKRTGIQYGLEVNSEVDERYHLEKSTRAACRFLKDSYATYNNWILAAASYNIGREGIRKRTDKQKVSDYFDLYLPIETARYVYRILAMKVIFENPATYGFKLSQSDLYKVVPVETIIVDKPLTDLAGFALEHNINYKILREFNPWLRSYKLSNKSGKTYEILIPDNRYLKWNKLKKREEEYRLFNDN